MILTFSKNVRGQTQLVCYYTWALCYQTLPMSLDRLCEWFDINDRVNWILEMLGF
jgi:hypothetical protein